MGFLRNGLLVGEPSARALGKQGVSETGLGHRPHGSCSCSPEEAPVWGQAGVGGACVQPALSVKFLEKVTAEEK